MDIVYSRNARQGKREEPYNMDVDAPLERLRKARALGCNPSDIGIDNLICRKLFSNRASVLTKYI